MNIMLNIAAISNLRPSFLPLNKALKDKKYEESNIKLTKSIRRPLKIEIYKNKESDSIIYTLNIFFLLVE
nr:hypothetical protein [Providencia rettgeri]